MLSVVLKCTLLLFVFAIMLFLSDSSGLFISDAENDHVKHRWDSFYEFSRRNNVDVLLLGNSHMYTGINPENLSNALGANAFILAAPGTSVIDSYYSLKEALDRCKPGLVVLETYGINHSDPGEFSANALGEQIKSFSARKDVVKKLLSVPYLFPVSSYAEALSPTILNHHYMYSDEGEFKRNIEYSKKEKEKDSELFLGRYIRFTEGIDSATMSEYDTKGAPVDGNEFTYSDNVSSRVDKIVKLCADRKIELVFLTLPMYYKHVKNYNTWKTRLETLLNQYPNAWIDFQEPYEFDDFTPECFENTHNINQHMTYVGSLVATYKLAAIIKSKFSKNLEDRSKDRIWIESFSNLDGYLENRSPRLDNAKVRTVARDKVLDGIRVKEFLLVNSDDANRITLIAKIPREYLAADFGKDDKLSLLVRYESNGKIAEGEVPLSYDYLHEPLDHAVFKQEIQNSVKITDLLSVYLPGH